MITDLTQNNGAAALAALITAEDAYQAARVALEQAEAQRYAAVWSAVTACEDIRTVQAVGPKTVTQTTIKAAVRRHAGAASPWLQPELW